MKGKVRSITETLWLDGVRVKFPTARAPQNSLLLTFLTNIETPSLGPGLD